MGKAVRSPRPKSATAKDPNRVSIEAAGDALRRVFGNSHVSRECLDKAIRERRVRLWCDDYLLSPEYFARELRVALESDERFTIGSIRAMERSNYVWMVSREDLTKLTERERLDDVHENLSTNPVGRPKDYQYDQICGVGKGLLAIGVDDTQAGFFERVRNACGERGIVTPGESRGMGRIVGELYSASTSLIHQITAASIRNFGWRLFGHMRKPRQGERKPRPPGGDYEIAEWCALRRISVAMFYRLDAQGRAPDTVYTGRRRTIPQSADERWVRENSSSNDVAT